MESMQKKIKKDPELGEDQLNDHNSIEEMLMLGYFLKTMKLVTMILNISFFVGIFFYVICDLQAQIYESYYTLPKGCTIADQCGLCPDEKWKTRCIEKEWYMAPGPNQVWDAADQNVITFIKHFNLESFCMQNPDNCVPDPNKVKDQKSGSQDIRILWTIIYYSFTSLTTVGFGDYHPKSDYERLLCLFILMFGVAIFSYIMGNFIQIVVQFREFNQEIDEGDELTKFFGLI
jgi:hypothetical protein